MKGAIILSGACFAAFGLAAPLEARAAPNGIHYTVNDGDESSPYNFQPVYAVNNDLMVVGTNGDISSTTYCPKKVSPCPGSHGPAVFLNFTNTPAAMHLNTVKPAGGQQVYGVASTGEVKYLDPGQKLPKGAFANGWFVDADTGKLMFHSTKYKKNSELNTCDDGTSDANFKLYLDFGNLGSDCGPIHLFPQAADPGYGAYRYT